ncbi:hypothetical protein [Cupriavidus necator]|uniref:hypothetical protein n=1 Tax=Cupriavidus necator TaxID=106590 RepID=UPI0005B4F65C|nr:hypothetical protein [Cupriavidus necator]
MQPGELERDAGVDQSQGDPAIAMDGRGNATRVRGQSDTANDTMQSTLESAVYLGVAKTRVQVAPFTPSKILASRYTAGRLGGGGFFAMPK